MFYFAFEAIFQVQAPGGAYIWRGDLTEGFLRYQFGGLIHGGAYFRNFKVSFVFAIVLLSLSLLLVLSMSDQPIPEAVFEIQSTDVCERSWVDYLDGLSQGKKKTMVPFFSCTC